MKTIVFQGDSITDCGRNRQDPTNAGSGYPLLVKAALGFDKPGAYQFYNRGISGNRIVDLYARIKCDIINLAPDCVSILIGVNDVWHEFDMRNGVDSEKYEKVYRMLIDELLQALPSMKIMILEPFCLRERATENTEAAPDKWNLFHAEVVKRAEKAKKIAEQYSLPFVELQSKFDEAARQTGNAYWLGDGVHPSPMGHELMKREWLKTFERLGV